jgi:hypothetical protein
MLEYVKRQNLCCGVRLNEVILCLPYRVGDCILEPDGAVSDVPLWKGGTEWMHHSRNSRAFASYGNSPGKIAQSDNSPGEKIQYNCRALTDVPARSLERKRPCLWRATQLTSSKNTSIALSLRRNWLLPTRLHKSIKDIKLFYIGRFR